ncbi:hypothetical protein C8R44DRAFT_892271 [Mycena epipterygia]|nr:hypothetical protein C8R44DRAFT_892271 [Mycena epipterygia]
MDTCPDHDELAVAADAHRLTTQRRTLDDGRHSLGSDDHIRAEHDDSDGTDRDCEGLQGHSGRSRKYPPRLSGAYSRLFARLFGADRASFGQSPRLCSFLFFSSCNCAGLVGLTSRAYFEEIGCDSTFPICMHSTPGFSSYLPCMGTGTTASMEYTLYSCMATAYDPILFAVCLLNTVYFDEWQLISYILASDSFYSRSVTYHFHFRLIATFHLYAATAAAPLPATWDPPLAPESPHHTNFNSLRVNANANTPHNSILDPVPRPNNHGTHKPEYRMDARRGLAFAHSAGPCYGTND